MKTILIIKHCSKILVLIAPFCGTAIGATAYLFGEKDDEAREAALKNTRWSQRSQQEAEQTKAAQR